MIRPTPELVQFGALRLGHFEQSPIWVNCHTQDQDEPWHDDTDEETFRPWLGETPVGPELGMFLVAAGLKTAGGTGFGGFMTPCSYTDGVEMDSALGIMQPYLFLPSGRPQGFWHGGLAIAPEELASFYDEIAQSPERIFPIAFAATPGLATGITSGLIQGFYSAPTLRSPPIIVR
jgi:hypothetical protein